MAKSKHAISAHVGHNTLKLCFQVTSFLKCDDHLLFTTKQLVLSQKVQNIQSYFLSAKLQNTLNKHSFAENHNLVILHNLALTAQDCISGHLIQS